MHPSVAFRKIVLLLCVMSLSVAVANADIKTVKDFGAVGDGVTNDASAIQAAINATGVAYIPAGVFRISTAINLPSDSVVTGPGTLYVNFDSGNAGAGNTALYVNGDNVKISDICIEKNFIDGSYASGIIAGSGHKNISIKDVEISGYSVRYGIHIIECSEFTISGCYIHDFMMNVGGANAPDMIEDSPAGIRVTRSEHGTISNNLIMRINVGPNGITSISELVPDYGPQNHQADNLTVMQCKWVSVTGNVMMTSGEGIDMLLSEHCSVSGNVIHDIYLMAVKMLGNSYSSITSNHIMNTCDGFGLSNHAGVDQPCRGNVVAENTIVNPGATGSFGTPVSARTTAHGGWGIFLANSSEVNGNIIANNVVIDNQSPNTMAGGIHENTADGNVYDNNIVHRD